MKNNEINTEKRGYSGEVLGAILYLHYVKGLTVSEIRKTPIGYSIPSVHIRSIIKGSFSPDQLICLCKY